MSAKPVSTFVSSVKNQGQSVLSFGRIKRSALQPLLLPEMSWGQARASKSIAIGIALCAAHVLSCFQINRN
jgi:hypothetical protein